VTPVTALSFLRYNRGFRVRHLEPHRLADDLLKRLEVPGRCPDFQLSVAGAVELNDDVLPAIVHFEA